MLALYGPDEEMEVEVAIDDEHQHINVVVEPRYAPMELETLAPLPNFADFQHGS